MCERSEWRGRQTNCASDRAQTPALPLRLQGRRAHPFGWWLGTVQAVRGDRVVLLFRQYPRSSVWHRVKAPIKPGREAVVNGDCSFGCAAAAPQRWRLRAGAGGAGVACAARSSPSPVATACSYVGGLRRLALHERDEFLVVASDGLWDVFNSQEAVTLARGDLKKGRTPQVRRAAAECRGGRVC